MLILILVLFTLRNFTFVNARMQGQKEVIPFFTHHNSHYQYSTTQPCRTVIGQKGHNLMVTDWAGKLNRLSVQIILGFSVQYSLLPSRGQDPSGIRILWHAIRQGRSENLLIASSYIERWGKVRVIFIDFMTCFGREEL